MKHPYTGLLKLIKECLNQHYTCIKRSNKVIYLKHTGILKICYRVTQKRLLLSVHEESIGHEELPIAFDGRSAIVLDPRGDFDSLLASQIIEGSPQKEPEK